MFPYLWAYAGLLALAGAVFAIDGREDVLRGLCPAHTPCASEAFSAL